MYHQDNIDIDPFATQFENVPPRYRFSQESLTLPIYDNEDISYDYDDHIEEFVRRRINLKTLKLMKAMKKKMLMICMAEVWAGQAKKVKKLDNRA